MRKQERALDIEGWALPWPPMLRGTIAPRRRERFVTLAARRETAEWLRSFKKVGRPCSPRRIAQISAMDKLSRTPKSGPNKGRRWNPSYFLYFRVRNAFLNHELPRLEFPHGSGRYDLTKYRAPTKDR